MLIADLHRDFVKLLRQWDAKGSHFAAALPMNAVGTRWALGLYTRLEALVTLLERKKEHRLVLGDGAKAQGSFDWAILPVPSTRTAVLLPEKIGDLDRAESARQAAYWTSLRCLQVPPARRKEQGRDRPA